MKQISLSLLCFFLFQQTLRLLFWLLFSDDFHDFQFSETIYCFLTGIRFDLMTSAYCALPIYLIMILQLFVPDSKLGTRLWTVTLRFMNVLILFGILVVWLLDIKFYRQHSDHFNSRNVKEFTKLVFGYNFISAHWGLIVVLILILGLSIGYLIRLNLPSIFFAKKREAFFAFFLLALLARGSLGPHHLDLRHSEVSGHLKGHLLVLNSLYSLDQALRGRR